VSFANKNVSGLQKCLRFQNEYNKVEIELRVVLRFRCLTSSVLWSITKSKTEIGKIYSDLGMC
jgi:hypothetical protein